MSLAHTYFIIEIPLPLPLLRLLYQNYCCCCCYYYYYLYNNICFVLIISIFCSNNKRTDKIVAAICK